MAAGCVDAADDARRLGDDLRLLGARRGRVSLRRRHAPGGGRRRYRHAVPRATSTRSRPRANRWPTTRAARGDQPARTRCSRRTCSCCGSTRAPGYQDTGPYPLADGRVLLLRAYNRLGVSHFPWSAEVSAAMPHREVLGAFVLRDAQLRVTDFGTSVTNPRTTGRTSRRSRSSTCRRARSCAIDDRAARRARRPRRRRRRSSCTARSRAWNGAAKIDAGAYVYFTFLRPFAELAGRRDRLDGAARQPRPLPVPRAHRRLDRRRRPDAPVETPETYYLAARAAAVSRWLLDFAAPPTTARRASCGSSVRDDERIAWYWTYLVGVPDVDGVLVVRDHEVLPPRQGLEIRADGLWAELYVRDARASTGRSGSRRSACGSTRPRKRCVPGGEIGERIAVGLDIEWEVTARRSARGHRARRRARRPRPGTRSTARAGSTTTARRDPGRVEGDVARDGARSRSTAGYVERPTRPRRGRAAGGRSTGAGNPR